jgi:hypothetical protein
VYLIALAPAVNANRAIYFIYFVSLYKYITKL